MLSDWSASLVWAEFTPSSALTRVENPMSMTRITIRYIVCLVQSGVGRPVIVIRCGFPAVMQWLLFRVKAQ